MARRETIIGWILLGFAGTAAWGLVCHDADWPLPTELPDMPPKECMARIDNGYTKVSAAVIAPNFIITARHWTDQVSKKLSLGDEDTANYILVEGREEPCSDIAVYKVKKLQWHDPQHPGDARNPQPQDYNDLKDAQFNRWVDIYTAEDELGKTSTIGSYGPQRIAIGDEVIAQANNPPILIDPGQLHWGRNIVSWASPIRLYMTFSPVGRGDYVQYEIYAGKWDSAAAWFIKDGQDWKLASFSSGPCEGPRLGRGEYANWIHDQIWLMSGIAPAAKAAKNPSPAVDSSATEYPLLLLTWEPGEGAVQHDVYLGAGSRSVEAADRYSQGLFKGTSALNIFKAEGLEPAQKYYWRVDEVDSDGHVTKGLVWWFTYTPHRVQNTRTGNWYCFIQDAMDSADAGDEIEVKEGLYPEILRFYDAHGYKAVKVRSTHPCNWDVVKATRIFGGAIFMGSRGQVEAEISGFSIALKKFKSILISDSSPTIARCIIEGDDETTSDDVAIHVYGDSMPTIVNSFICYSFIGLYFDGANSGGIVRNNTIVHNDYGIASGDDCTAALISNCIVWGNGSDPNCNLVGVFDGVEYSCIGGWPCEQGKTDANGNFDSVPRFVNEDVGDFHLTVNSPCINAGGPADNLWPDDMDIDGQPRVMGGAIDVGADEVALQVQSHAEQFSDDRANGGFDLSNKAIMFIPVDDGMSYAACLREISRLPTDPAWGKELMLSDDTYSLVSLTDQKTVSIYGSRFSSFYVGSNGYVTFSEGDHSAYSRSLSCHFDTRRISCLFGDFDPSVSGMVGWQQLTDCVVVTWQDIPEFGRSNSNTFQVEMYFDGRIQLAWLAVAATEGIVGLSEGLGLPADFQQADFSDYPGCRVGPPAISGYVRTDGGSGLSGVTLIFSPDQVGGGGSTTTDSRGYYSKTVPYGSSGVVTPGLTGYTFSPPSRSYTNVTSDMSHEHYMALANWLPDYFTEQFSSGADAFDLSNKAIMFIPTSDGTSYAACLREIGQLPTDPVWGTPLILSDDSYKLVSLAEQNTVSIYGSSFPSFYVGSNGYITFYGGDYDCGESFSNHFNAKRISCLFNDFDPSAGGMVTWQQLADRVVVTWQDIAELDRSNSSTFQVEMYFDGRIQLAWLEVESKEGLVGLSGGLGLPANFQETDFLQYPQCQWESPIISGYVRTYGGYGIGGVILTFSNGGGSSITDSNGYYSNTVWYGWSGVVTPGLTGYTFSPPSRSYTNVTLDVSREHYMALANWLPDYFAEQFSSGADAFDLSNKAIMFIPAIDGASYGACLREISRLPTDPIQGTRLILGDDTCALISLTDQKTVSIYGSSFPCFYAGSNGYITFSEGDYDCGESFSDHFNAKRISCLFNDFDPSAGGAVTWQQLSNRVVVTWQDIPELGRISSNTFQVEMYFDGRIQLAWLQVESQEGLVGLSEGLGLPTDFQETNLSAYPACKMEPPDICGYIWTFSGSGIAGVTLTFSNGGGSATTDNSGYYSKMVSSAWSGVVTPSRSGYTFSPPSMSYPAVTSDLSDQNYVGFAVWGDFDADNDVDLADFAMFAERWRRTDSSFRYGGGGADFTDDTYVDFNDLKKLAGNWLASVQ